MYQDVKLRTQARKDDGSDMDASVGAEDKSRIKIEDLSLWYDENQVRLKLTSNYCNLHIYFRLPG